MMAIIKTGGKQYSVKAGQILKVERLEGKKGDNILFDNVLAILDSSKHTFGEPLINGASVEAKILEQIRDKKIIVFKKRKRQNYRSTHGHRQYLTVLQIESIMPNGTKSKAPKKEGEVNKIENKSVALKKEVSQKVKKKIALKKTVTKKTNIKKITKKKTKKTKK